MGYRASSRTAVSATAVVGVLLVSCLTAIGLPTAPAADAAVLPEGAETFEVSGDHGGESQDAFLTPDAQQIVFTSSAIDLVPGDDNGVPDVFLEKSIEGSDDPFSREPVLVSVPDGPVGVARANDWSSEAVSSADGRYVAFTSAATNLVDLPSTGDGRSYVYVRDTANSTTIRIQGVDEPNGSSFLPDLSDDGRYLVFTSEADNLVSSPDLNGAADSFVVDLDANADGARGDLMIEQVASGGAQTGTHDVVISGDGNVVAYLSTSDPRTPLDPPRGTDGLYFMRLERTDERILSDAAVLIDDNIVGRVSIDSTGYVYSYVRAGACMDQAESVVAASWSTAGTFRQALGTILADVRSGWVADPRISADGSTVAWTTTVPAFDFGNGGVPAAPLAEAVVRLQAVSWWDASGSEFLQCSGILAGEWFDVAEGSHATLSASGRTVAFQSPEPARVYAVDRHSGDGISVSSVQGALDAPPFMTEVPIAAIPVASLRDYAAALADSPVHRIPVHRIPVHRIPVHRIPVHRIPVHRIPVHRIPVHRIDFPGGWTQVLVGSPYEGQLIQSVMLDDVLKWAKDNPETDAGKRILSLTLDDIDIDDSGLDSLSLASYVLGDALLADLAVPGSGTNLERWRMLAAAQGLEVEVGDETVLATLDSEGLDIAATGIDQLDLSALDDEVLDATTLGWMLIDPALLPGTPLGQIDVSSLDDAARLALFGDASVTGTLAEPSVGLLDSATFATLVQSVPGVTLGDVLFSLLDAESYPWEQIDTAAIDPLLATDSSPIECVGGARCGSASPFRFVFDVGPGEPTLFEAPTATVTLPAGTGPSALSARGSGPGISWNDAQPV